MLFCILHIVMTNDSVMWFDVTFSGDRHVYLFDLIYTTMFVIRMMEFVLLLMLISSLIPHPQNGPSEPQSDISNNKGGNDDSKQMEDSE